MIRGSEDVEICLSAEPQVLTKEIRSEITHPYTSSAIPSRSLFYYCQLLQPPKPHIITTDDLFSMSLLALQYGDKVLVCFVFHYFVPNVPAVLRLTQNLTTTAVAVYDLLA